MKITEEMIDVALEKRARFELIRRHIDCWRVITHTFWPGKLQAWDETPAPTNASLRYNDFSTEEAAHAFIKREITRLALEAVAPLILRDAAKKPSGGVPFDQQLRVQNMLKQHKLTLRAIDAMTDQQVLRLPLVGRKGLNAARAMIEAECFPMDTYKVFG